MFVENQWRLDLLVASLFVLGSPEGFQLIADDHALRQEERETRTLLGQHEQIHFLADLAVISLFCFLQFCNVVIQFLLAWERCRIDSLQHLSVRIPSPVSACHAHQLACLDLSGRFHVRTRAKIRKVTLRVHGDDRIFGQVLNQLHLVVLVSFLEEFERFLSGNLASDQRQILLYDFLHFLLDLQEILLCEFVLGFQVIVESVIDRRTDRKFRVRPQVLDRLRHDMGCGMSVGMSDLFIFPV